MTATATGLDEDPGQPVSAVVALGANLGDRQATLQSALDGLATFEGVRLRAVSPVVETSPVGGPDQPDYLNAVVLLDTTLSPLGLLAACQQVEADHGRTRSVRWGPRTLDLDLIRYDRLLAASPHLHLPHPRAAVRAFVLEPWLALEPDAVLPAPDGDARGLTDDSPTNGGPGGGAFGDGALDATTVEVPVRELLAAAPDRDGLRRRPDLRLEVPR